MKQQKKNQQPTDNSHEIIRKRKHPWALTQIIIE